VGPEWNQAGLVFTREDGSALPPVNATRHSQKRLSLYADPTAATGAATNRLAWIQAAVQLPITSVSRKASPREPNTGADDGPNLFSRRQLSPKGDRLAVKSSASNWVPGFYVDANCSPSQSRPPLIMWP